MYFELKKLKNINDYIIYQICIYCSLEDKELLKEEIHENPDIVDDKEIHYIYCNKPSNKMFDNIISELNINDEYIITGNYNDKLKYSKQKIISLSETKIEYDITNINHNCLIECITQQKYHMSIIDNSNEYLNDFFFPESITKPITFKNVKLRLFKYLGSIYTPDMSVFIFNNCQVDRFNITGLVMLQYNVFN